MNTDIKGASFIHTRNQTFAFRSPITSASIQFPSRMQHSSDPTIAAGDNAQTKFVDPPSSMFTLKNEPTIADAIPEYKAPTRQQGKKKNAKKNAAATANIVTTKTIRMTVIADLKAILALILVNLTLLWMLALHIQPNVFYKNYGHVQISNSNGSTVYGILILAFVILGALAVQTNSPICGLLNPCSKLIPFYIFPGLTVYFLFEASSVAAQIGDFISLKRYEYNLARFFLDVFCCVAIAGLLVVFFIFALRMPQVDETSTLGPFGGFECSSYFRMPQKMQGATSTVIVSQSKPNVQPEPFGPSVFVPISAPAPAPLRPSGCGGPAKLDELPPQQPNTSPVKKQTTTTAAANDKEQQKSAPKQQQSGKQQQKESQYNGYVVDGGGRKTAPVTSTTLTMPTGTSILG